jgi:hypothetical protein
MISDAIAYGRPDASDVEVEAAAREDRDDRAHARQLPARNGRARTQPAGRAAAADHPGRTYLVDPRPAARTGGGYAALWAALAADAELVA